MREELFLRGLALLCLSVMDTDGETGWFLCNSRSNCLAGTGLQCDPDRC